MNYISIYDYFRTPDIHLTACLCCLGYEVDSIDRTRDQKVFLIKRDDLIDGYVQQYFSHKLTVDPLSYAHTMKELKTLLYHVYPGIE
jgi:hypothetical protein